MIHAVLDTSVLVQGAPAGCRELVFNHEARRSDFTRIQPTAPRKWDVTQVLVDPEGDNMWYVEAEIDLTDEHRLEGPLLQLRRIGR